MPIPDHIPRWECPREWEGQTAFVICGGSSVDKGQRATLHSLFAKGEHRFIAIKQSVEALPLADVMLCGNKDDYRHLGRHFDLYKGPRLIARTWYAHMPERTLFMRRYGSHKGWGKHALSKLPTHLAGFDTGMSGINLAYLFGAKEIVVAGMDMTGGHWMAKHPLQNPPRDHFTRHMEAIVEIADDLKKEGVPVWNASPISALKCWPHKKLEEWL